jgi:hypothetical protein
MKVVRIDVEGGIVASVSMDHGVKVFVVDHDERPSPRQLAKYPWLAELPEAEFTLLSQGFGLYSHTEDEAADTIAAGNGRTKKRTVKRVKKIS